MDDATDASSVTSVSTGERALADFVGRLVDAVAARRHGDVRTLVGQRHGYLPADALATAGDECGESVCIGAT